MRRRLSWDEVGEAFSTTGSLPEADKPTLSRKRNAPTDVGRAVSFKHGGSHPAGRNRSSHVLPSTKVIPASASELDDVQTKQEAITSTVPVVVDRY
jgi:hypothetical protein